MPSSPDLLTVSTNAFTLRERMNTPPGPWTLGTEYAHTFFNKWQDKLPSGSHEYLEKRLAYDGWCPEQVLHAMSVEPKTRSSLPAWTAVLEKVMNHCPQALKDVTQDPGMSSEFGKDDVSIIFPELWLPFYLYAWEAIKERTPSALKIFTSEAVGDIKRQFFVEISLVGGLAAYRQFAAYRKIPAFSESLLSSDQSTIYEAFIASQLNGKLLPLVREYAVLGRQLCGFAESWIEIWSELILRFDTDLSNIREEFSDDGRLGSVVGLDAGLSDRHNGGRRVVKFKFASGFSLIYKPRNVDQEFGFNQLLKWLQQNELVSLPRVEVIRRQGYGWESYVSRSECTSKREVERYYRQAGMLMCLVYALGGSDFHMENVKATSKGPVLVDVETLLQPRNQTGETILREGALSGAAASGDSVLDSGLLVMSTQGGKKGWHEDISGFRGAGDFKTYKKARKWIDPHSDAMRFEFEDHFLKPGDNMVLFNGRGEYPEDHRFAIEEGFERMYTVLLSYRDAMLERDGPLQALQKAPVRLLLRRSDVYALFLLRILHPDNQKIGWEASLVTEYLTGILANSPKHPELWKAIRREQQALENLDIPHFTVEADEIHQSRIMHLCNDDLNHQLLSIRAVLTAFKNSGIDIGPHALKQPGNQERDLTRIAGLIAEKILEQSKNSPPDGLVWNTPEYMWSEKGKSRLPPDLYRGVCGIAVFFAAMARIVDRAKFSKFTRQICNPVIRDFEQSEGVNDCFEGGAIGICNGVGSGIFALLTISRLLNDPYYLGKAKLLASRLKPAMIRSDRQLDVEGGSAGCLLALTALYNEVQEAGILELASVCAQHLLDTSHLQSDTRAWANSEGLKMAGYAHGASGIGLSLLRYAAISGERECVEAGIQAFRYERTLFSSEQCNWPVLTKRRDGGIDDSNYMTSWCHGAPGIGLARVASLEIVDNPDVRADIKYAMDTTIKSGLSTIDTMCCGNIGRADILLTAGQCLDAPVLVKTAEKLVVEVVERAVVTGFWGLQTDEWKNRCFQPDFFRGWSGIGYTLLRVAHPEVLKSILLFS